MSPEQATSEGAPRGAVLKIFGVVLICLGALDSLLSWRGGLVLNDFYVFLLAGGTLLYAAGAIRCQRGRR